MKYLLVALSLFFLAPFSQLKAQQAIPFSNIYLKGGGFLQGQILNQDSLGVINIRLRSGDEVELKHTSINRINTSSNKEIIHPKGHTTRTEGFYSKLQFGLLTGISGGEFGYWTSSAQLFSFSAGHQFNPRWQVGGGVAFDVYDHEFLPLFVEGKYILNPKSRASWYASLQTGYALSFSFSQVFDNGYGGGAMIHPAVGIRFSGKKKSSFLLELGNRYQWGTEQNFWSQSIDRIIYRRLALRVGWEF